MKKQILLLSIPLFFTLYSINAQAWGKRGHHIVGEMAAILASGEKDGAFLKAHSYDLGYYNNVPDLVWKRPATYKVESTNHFMDMELFKVPLAKKNADIKTALQLSREEFNKKHPEVPEKAGRAFWRIQEMNDRLQEITKALRKKNKKEKHQELQGEWLVVAGTLGHYIADLAQPLHVTENYDGQLSDQKGIHEIFEVDYVDALYPDIAPKVLEAAKKRWAEFKKASKKQSLHELLWAGAEESHKDLESLLAMDKKQDRKKTTENAKAFEEMLVRRMAHGSVMLAEIFRRHLGWKYQGEKFYFFGSEPAHFPVGKPSK